MKLFGPLGVGLGFTLEGFGLPIPMELLYGILGKMVGSVVSYPVAVAIAAGGTVIGNLIGYWIGASGGRRLMHYAARALDLKPDQLDRFEGWFRKHGLLALFVVRWFGLGYAQLTWFCGLARVPLWRFLGVAAVADTLWAAVWTYAGNRLIHLLHFLFPPPVVITIAAAFLTGLTVFAVRAMRRIREVEREQSAKAARTAAKDKV